MSSIKRFDAPQPTASTSATSTAADGMTDLARKIEERQRKRKAAEAGLESNQVSAPSVSALPVKVLPVVDVPVWQPAAGESPAEREKREKREKRAAKMGVTFDLNPAPPSGSHYVPPPPASSFYTPSSYPQRDQQQQQQPYDNNSNDYHPPTAASIHPSRMQAVPVFKEKKEKDPNKDKTPAKKRYLKKKKERSRGKKAGEPTVGKKPRKLPKGDAAKDSDDSDASSEDSDDERDKLEAAEQKKSDIIKKKEERKIKRDEKKAEARKIKADGGVPLAPVARVLPSKLPVVPATIIVAKAVEEETVPAEPTVEELEAAVAEAARLARKETKRMKRTTRRLSPVPGAEVPVVQVAPEPEPEVVIPEDEPAPLLRLPGATRPAPPSAKTLSASNVHESVRAKRVIDPELKMSLGPGGLGLSERAQKRLGEMGIESAFAVQTAVLPLLLPIGVPSFLYSPFAPPQDICVSAPTGSGKTLSYVVPIVETLNNRVVTRLRALVLLPTRDLVAQVREAFEQFGKGTGLKIGTATGQHSFAHEQVALVGENVPASVQGGCSEIDILIATPGRLMDHIRSTPGFSLQHLRYLVIDEADRLLNQSFHDWLPSILTALKPAANSIVDGSLSVASDALAPEVWDAHVGRVASDLDERCLPSTQKLLFSATLSRDPAKIAALHLHRPIYVSVEDAIDPNGEDDDIDDELKFTLPATLTEHMIVSPSTHKPLYLFHLLHTLSLSSALCFTKSVDAATRLAKLVEFFEEERAKADPAATKVVVKSYSSDLPASERTKILASFKKGEIQMLICSDLISRGIDLPFVSHVISYDIPTDMRKYVHRVGRTARAGKTGDAWSLVEDQEAAPFKAIMNAAQHLAKISRVRVKDNMVESFVPHYQVALERLRVHFSTSRDTTI